MLMNLHSVGTKVITIIVAIVGFIFIVFLLAFKYFGQQRIISDEIERAKTMVMVSEAIRENVNRKWQEGTYSADILKTMNQTSGSEEEKRSRILSTVPIMHAIEALHITAKERGFQFKTPRIGARNPLNEADAIEQKAIQFFISTPNTIDYSYVDDQKDEIRVFRSVKLSKQCEICHGSPNNSMAIWGNANGKDILGYTMENKHEGDIIGAFEIITPLHTAYDRLHEQLLTAIGLSFVALILIAFIGYVFMSHIVISPLTELALKLQNIASREGNLDSRLDASGKNEFAWIAGSFNKFVKKIALTVDNINSTSEQLVNASKNLSEITKAAEAGIERQLAETTQVATAMEEMTATVQEVARSAFRASDAATTADTEALNSKNIINDAVLGINLLASEVENAAQVIKELESDSNSIGEVLSTIQGIAEQTNLLALNAAIEAARAGEQGRGFAVVADEVRTLASRTQNSTLEIQKTIERLQSRAEQAVKAMQQSKTQAGSSVQQAASSGTAIANISAKIDTISDMNHQIANAAEEQTAVAEEINRNISNINQISHATSRGVIQSTTACQELLQLADQLRACIAEFKK